MRSSESSNQDNDYLDQYPIILPSSMHEWESSDAEQGALEEKKKLSPATHLHPPAVSDITNPNETPLQKLLLMDQAPREDWHSGWDHLWGTLMTKPTPQEAPASNDGTTQQSSTTMDDSIGQESTSVSPSRTSSFGSFSAFDWESPNAPREMDVICIRGRAFYRHPGNARFRALVRKHMAGYERSNRRMDRSVVINSLLAEVRDHPSSKEQPVRLLKWDKSCEKWETLDDHHARDKVSHALRDAVQEAEGKRLPS